MNHFGSTRNVLDDYDVVQYKPKHFNLLKLLLGESFGRIAEIRGALNKDILKYYQIVLDDKTPVAVTGIVPSEFSMFDGYEVSWTCTSPKYRGSGICTELLRKCILDLPNDGIPLFCDCWRFPGKQINLFNAMQSNGFQLLVPEASVFSTKFSKLCASCPYRHDDEPSCRCYTDVWKFERKL